MENPYEAPKTQEVAAGSWVERGSGPAKARVVDYLMAVISGLFVTFGTIIVFVFSPVLIGERTIRLHPIVFAAVPFVAIGLGMLSAWQSIRQAKRKAAARR